MKLFGRRKSPAEPVARPPVLEVASVDKVGDDLTYAFAPEVAVLHDGHSKVSDALRATALGILDQHVRQGHRSLALCGVTRGVGVSFVATNLAVALAIDGVSTLLIDADLTRPSLETLVRPSRPTLGLQQYLLTPGMSREDVIHRDIIPGFSMMYAGGPSEHASELIGQARFGELVRACMRDHDLVILDTPPASLTANARQVAVVSHYALIVARASATHVDGVEELSKSLLDDGVEVVGSILNAA